MMKRSCSLQMRILTLQRTNMRQTLIPMVLMMTHSCKNNYQEIAGKTRATRAALSLERVEPCAPSKASKSESFDA